MKCHPDWVGIALGPYQDSLFHISHSSPSLGVSQWDFFLKSSLVVLAGAVSFISPSYGLGLLEKQLMNSLANCLERFQCSLCGWQKYTWKMGCLEVLGLSDVWLKYYYLLSRSLCHLKYHLTCFVRYMLIDWPKLEKCIWKMYGAKTAALTWLVQKWS